MGGRGGSPGRGGRLLRCPLFPLTVTPLSCLALWNPTLACLVPYLPSLALPCLAMPACLYHGRGGERGGGRGRNGGRGGSGRGGRLLRCPLSPLTVTPLSCLALWNPPFCPALLCLALPCHAGLSLPWTRRRKRRRKKRRRRWIRKTRQAPALPSLPFNCHAPVLSCLVEPSFLPGLALPCLALPCRPVSTMEEEEEEKEEEEKEWGDEEDQEEEAGSCVALSFL
jgi:hypothetical protein